MEKTVFTLLFIYFFIQMYPGTVESRSFYGNDVIRTRDDLSPHGNVLYVTDDDGNKIPIITTNAPAFRTIDGTKRNKDRSKTEDFSRTTSFMLFTNPYLEKYELLNIDDDDALLKSSFNPELPTRIITHGWSASNTTKSCTLVRDAYLEEGDFNIIIFDWSAYSKKMYFQAIQYINPLASHVSKMISFLISHQMDPDLLTLIGHSLGAHIMGVAGYKSDVQIHQLIGLDPALPMFTNAGPGERISTDDAKHVQIIHTNGGYLGFDKPIGHFDYYPNGGTFQLGCDKDDFTCSHSRSAAYFAESIQNPNGFYAYRCNSYEDYENRLCDPKPILMGHRYSLPPNGTYYLDTNDRYPYAQGMKF